MQAARRMGILTVKVFSLLKRVISLLKCREGRESEQNHSAVHDWCAFFSEGAPPCDFLITIRRHPSARYRSCWRAGVLACWASCSASRSLAVAVTNPHGRASASIALSGGTTARVVGGGGHTMLGSLAKTELPMPLHRLIVCIHALALCAPGFPLACAAAGVAPASNPRAPTLANAGSAVSPSASVASGATTPASVAPGAPAPTAASPAASAPEALAPAPPPSVEPTPPCIDGEVVMGACICDTGKTADADGHCGYPPCPKSTTGGAAFRDERTGQCMECRAGTTPTKDGRCEP